MCARARRTGGGYFSAPSSAAAGGPGPADLIGGVCERRPRAAARTRRLRVCALDARERAPIFIRVFITVEHRAFIIGANSQPNNRFEGGWGCVVVLFFRFLVPVGLPGHESESYCDFMRGKRAQSQSPAPRINRINRAYRISHKSIHSHTHTHANTHTRKF